MITEKILEADRLYGLFKPDVAVTVACSGGADSMALLHALCGLRERLHITVNATHYNHGIRGAEAERDAEFVADYCRKNRIPFKTETGDVPAFAEQNRISLETAAREMRYDFLRRVAGDGLIATAHTASDNLETVLLHLCRGAGGRGLCGIPPKRDGIVRPLLLCTREEIEAYCREHNLQFVQDSSNQTDFCRRNRLRHAVVPVLKELNPSVETAVLRTALSLRSDEEYFDGKADEFCQSLHSADGTFPIAELVQMPNPIAVRVLQKITAQQCGETVDYLHGSQLLEICRCGGRISLPHDYTATVSGKKLTFCQKNTPPKTFSVSLSEKNINFSDKNEKINNLLFKNAIDCDKIIGNLVVRTRLAGDTVRLKLSCGTKSLKKLYNEYHIPLDERENLPVLADDCGIVWVANLGAAERCAVSPMTKRMLEITF